MKVTAPTGESWLISKDKFDKRYESTDEPGLYRPIFSPVQVIRISRNVCFTAPWGEEMHIKSGGVLVRAGADYICGIQPEEFESSYCIITGAGEDRPEKMP